jgi:hypothetical protein
MEYQNLSKKIPTSIGIFVEEANNKIFSNKAFIEINEILSKKENLISYTYSIFTDANLVKENIYLPILNTLYIGSKFNNIIISNDNDLWLTSHFNNNKYYCIDSDFTEKMANAGVVKISSVKEIV